MSTQKKNIEELIDSLSHLSVLDMAKLKTALEDKWGVKATAAAPMMMAQAAAPAAEAAAEEGQPWRRNSQDQGSEGAGVDSQSERQADRAVVTRAGPGEGE